MMSGEESYVYSETSVYDGMGFSKKKESLIREIPLKICLNGDKVITIACTGLHVDELTVGFLYSEGFLEQKEDITEVEVAADQSRVNVRTTAVKNIQESPNHGTSVASNRARSLDGPMNIQGTTLSGGVSLAPETIHNLMEGFLGQARLHEETGGTHAAALVRNGQILIVREDIGRHNAIDMLGGYALLNGVDCRETVIFRTGRVSADIVRKVWRIGTPMVCSLSVPTTLAVETALEAGIKLIGSVRGGRLKIYT